MAELKGSKTEENLKEASITLLFENRDTIRFQIQEMARAEKILTDEGILSELDV